MRRSLKNLIVFVMALVMMLAMGITAFAADGTTPVKSIKIVNEGTTKKVGSATLYVNGNVDGIDDVYLGVNGKTATPVIMTYDLDIAGKVKDTTIVKNLSVATKNRAIATAKLITVDGKDKLVVTATGTGKTTITVTDAGTKKSAKLTVTVKKLVESIDVAAITETDELTGKEYVHLEQKGKVNLLASANADASTKTLKYVVMSNMVLKNGVWEDSVTVSGTKTKAVPVVKVDGKGNVSGLTEKRTDVEMAKAVVRVYAVDQKAVKENNKTVASGIYEDVTVYVYPATYASTDIIQFTNLGAATNKKLGKTNKYAAQTIYTNAADSAHTLKVTATAYNKVGTAYEKSSSQKVTYTTSNAKVATVSADGVVTAVGNGKATISAVPAYGFTAPKATVQVNVQTKPETITVANNELMVSVGKTVKVGASLPKNVSAKKLTYATSDTSIATVTNKGVIKGVKEGTATITVSVDGYANVTRKIKVEVIVPVDKITITEDAGLIKSNKVTLYAWNESKFTSSAPNTVTFKATATGKNGAEATYADRLSGSFDKNMGAYISGWSAENEITLKASTAKSGTSKFNVQSTDGSNKKATLSVTVKRLVDEINVTNAYTKYDEALEKNVQVLNVVKGTTVTIKAAANTDASNKSLNNPVMVSENDKVTLNKWKVTVAADATEDAVLTISAKDGVKIGDTTTEAFTQTVIIHPVAEGVYAKAEEVGLSVEHSGNDAAVKFAEDGTGLIVMKKGTSVTVSPDFYNDAIIDRTVTWKSGSAAVAVKNGVLTAKKNASDVVVTMTFKGQDENGNAANLTKQIKVCVVQSDADYQKALNKTVDTNLKAEDRTYLGVNVTFNSKTNTINADIKDASVVITDQKDTGILTVLESMIELTTQKVSVVDSAKSIKYTFERNGAFSVNVFKGDVYGQWIDNVYVENREQIATVDSFSAATEVLADELAALGYVTLGDMNGFVGNITVENATITAEGHPVLNNIAYYTMKCSMDSVNMDTVIDEKITAKMTELDANGVLEAAGIESVTYDAAANMAIVNIKDGKVTLAEVDAAARTAVVGALKEIFDGVYSADVTVSVDGMIDETQSFDSTTEDLDSAINKLFDKVIERVGAATEIGQFDGGKADARVFYQIGASNYSYDYTVKFARTASAVDAQVDERIAAEIANIDTKDSGLTAEYNAEANTLTVKVDKTDYSVMALQSTGLFAAIENTLKDIATAGADVSAVIAADEVQTTVEDLANVTRAQLEEAFGLTDDVTLVDLLDDSAVITVVYPQLSGDVSLTYTVNYELNMDLIDAAMNNVIVDALADAKAADAVIAEAVCADHAINVTIDANGDKLIAQTDVLYDLFKAAIPTGENGISAVSATFFGNDYQKTFAVSDIDKLAMEEVLTATAGVDGTNNVSDLDGAILKIKVVYNKGGVECAIVYSVAFDVINKEVIVQTPAEEVVEETVEEATEETVEEAIEATDEETTEETVEEAVEDSTEETIVETIV